MNQYKAATNLPSSIQHPVPLTPPASAWGKAPLTNFIDRTIAFFNPQAGIERTVTRARLQQFDYDGARNSGRRGVAGGSMFRNGSTKSQRINQDAITLMWESRDMEQNFCLWRGILTRTTQYALGTLR